MPARSLATPRKAGHIRVGIGGWKFAPWRDSFYPHDLPQRRELEYASRQLTSIEINSTYYRAQKAEIYAKWRGETPEGFVFSVKAPRYVVEQKKLADAADGVGRFVRGGLAELGDRLGPVLWQMPATRRFDANDIAAFLDQLPRELDGRVLRHVLEVRHASFACKEYVELMGEHEVPSVFTDSPDLPSFADVTGAFVYVRLKCSEAAFNSGYAPREIDAWAGRARLWVAGERPADLPLIADSRPAKGPPRDVFIYFIAGAKVRNPVAATTLLQRLGSK
ncbi:MAG: DUF72 domain-containing protein [Rhodanobacteraceae bacterium]